MRKGGVGRYYDAGGYRRLSKVGVERSSDIDWEGLLKLLLAGAVVAVVSKATAPGEQSSSAPMPRTLPLQPIPSWANKAVGGAVAAPVVWKGARTIYDCLESLEPPAQRALFSSLLQNSPPALPSSPSSTSPTPRP